MKIFLFVRDLGYGGTQRQLVALAQGLSRRGHDVTIAMFYPGGEFERDVSTTGIKVVSLDKRRRWDVYSFAGRALQLLRKERPDVMYSMLDGPNLYAALFKGFNPESKLIWGVRSSYVEWSNYSRLAYLTYRLCAWLSSVPHAVIFNSAAGLEFHTRNGFKNKQCFVVLNGIDTDRYYPDSAAAERTRRSWGINPEVTLVGAVGRLDAMKDLPTFFKAASELIHKVENLKIVCVGDGAPEYKSKLMALIERLNLKGYVDFVGFVDDMRSAYNAIDMLVSSSVGEGFPNVIGEAMACGTPCIATDVGDTAQIIGETGYLVPSRNRKLLENAIQSFLRMSVKKRSEFSIAASERIRQKYSIELMVSRTEEVLEEIVN